MPSQAGETFRAELVAQRSLLPLELEGLQRLLTQHLSTELQIEINQEANDHKRRIELIDATLQAMDSLDADGYPEMPVSHVKSLVYDELQAIIEAILAALEKFAPRVEAEQAVITPGDPEFKEP